MYFVLACNRAKISKQCKYCTKLELIYDCYQFIIHVFELWFVHENQISTLFQNILRTSKLRFE